MTWFTENWVWLLVGVAFVAMHLVGHSGHGGHGGNSGSTDRDQRGPRENAASPDTATIGAGRERDAARRRTTEPRGPHQH